MRRKSSPARGGRAETRAKTGRRLASTRRITRHTRGRCTSAHAGRHQQPGKNGRSEIHPASIPVTRMAVTRAQAANWRACIGRDRPGRRSAHAVSVRFSRHALCGEHGECLAEVDAVAKSPRLLPREHLAAVGQGAQPVGQRFLGLRLAVSINWKSDPARTDPGREQTDGRR